jgi:hypothetical protein
MRRPRLESLAIGHQRFDRKGFNRAGKPLAGALSPRIDRKRRDVLREVSIEVENA